MDAVILGREERSGQGGSTPSNLGLGAEVRAGTLSLGGCKTRDGHKTAAREEGCRTNTCTRPCPGVRGISPVDGGRLRPFVSGGRLRPFVMWRWPCVMEAVTDVMWVEPKVIDAVTLR